MCVIFRAFFALVTIGKHREISGTIRNCQELLGNINLMTIYSNIGLKLRKEVGLNWS